MFENIIKFSAKKDYLDNIFEEDKPEPIIRYGFTS